jgi:hypothetical protein
VHQVPLFGPRLPTETPVFDKGRDFTEFLYTKRSPLLSLSRTKLRLRTADTLSSASRAQW